MVYDDASGCTYLLDPLKAIVLDALSGETLTLLELIGMLESHFQTGGRVDLSVAVQGALEQLERSQLVEAVFA